MRVAATDGAVRTGFEGNEDGAAPCFDKADAETAGFGDGDRDDGGRSFEGGVGERRDQVAAEAEGLVDLAEAELDASGNVAVSFCDDFSC